MMVKLVWIVITLNILLILYLLLDPGNGQQDAVGKSMGNGFIGLITVACIISIGLINFSHHSLMLLLATIFSCGPLLLGVGVLGHLLHKLKPSSSYVNPVEVNFSSPLQIALAEAIYKGDTLALDSLVAQGAEVDKSEQGGKTPMEFAFMT